MKINLIVTIICITLISLVGSYTGQDAAAISQPSISRFNSIVIKEKRNVAGVAQLVAKKITTEFGTTVGNSFSICTEIAQGEVFGSGVQQCNATFNLPKGKIITIGTRHNTMKYTWVIVGGSGFYSNVGGTLNAFQTGANPRRESLVFHLVP